MKLRVAFAELQRWEMEEGRAEGYDPLGVVLLSIDLRMFLDTRLGEQERSSNIIHRSEQYHPLQTDQMKSNDLLATPMPITKSQL